MPRPKNKEEYRAALAEAFAGVLEEKGLDWKKEWQGSGGGAPQNAVTKACYRGSNAFWLSLVSMMKGYDDPRWVTMLQIMDRDGKYHPEEPWHLKKGSSATYVEYWFPYDAVRQCSLTWEQYRQELEAGRSEREFSFSARYTAVYNARDVEGMPELQKQERRTVSQDVLLTRLSDAMEVEIFFDGGDQAYYSLSQDAIHLPAPEAFDSTYAFNATALHELSHSTGHPARLNRLQSASFGSDAYAYEELVAEMCSCFMGSELQTEPTPAHIENHKAYVQSWVRVLRDRPDTLFRAIRDAQAAANYMDYKAGLMPEQEYAKTLGNVLELRKPEKSRER